ncbi:MAG TPA: hypothetical protein VHM24_12515 [Gemmatimonadaceae bacterium]|nr:hypothetical protein [Gemmatimonadaceae bacterium]
MISLLAWRNIVYRPWRSLLLFFGFGIGVGVMIVLLSVGEALLTQARDEKLVGGGDITVLPQGLDVEVMKTGGVGGLFFSIDHARFVYDQLLASRRLVSSVQVVAPQIDGRLVYLRTVEGVEYPARASGEIPSRAHAVHAPVGIGAGEWQDDDGDRRWISPAPAELRHEIDHFHLPPDSAANRSSWSEWHYFNVLSPDRKRWAFISFIVAGDVTSSTWGGTITVTLREEGRVSRKFEAFVKRELIRFSTDSANLTIGSSRVEVLPDGDYNVHAVAREQGGTQLASVDLVIHPEAHAYFPGASIGSGGFVSGYTVPALRAAASGRICIDASCEEFRGAQSYHDHNWGVWRGVTWDWGAARAGPFTILYGRVLGPEQQGRETPLFVYVVDSLGFRALMRPPRITYEEGGSALAGGNRIRAPSRAIFADVRGGDSLRVELEIEDAIATDTRRESRDQSPFSNRKDSGVAIDPIRDRALARPFFIQMKGIARISGRLGGERVSGEGTGFFETYR